MLSINTNVIASSLKGRRLHFSFASVTRKRLKKMPHSRGASPIRPSWGVPPLPWVFAPLQGGHNIVFLTNSFGAYVVVRPPATVYLLATAYLHAIQIIVKPG